MSFKLTILGSSGAMPAYGRHPSAQILEVHNKFFLIDCGEGAQMRLKQFGFSLIKIEHVFISHLHGDHYLGLMGFIFSQHLLKREKELHIYGPRGLDGLITLQLRLSNSVTIFPLIFHTLNTEKRELIFENSKLTVESLPVSHKIPTLGFIFKEKDKPRRIDKSKLPSGIKLQEIVLLKEGKDILDDSGKIVYQNKDLTLAARKSRSYAYLADTAYNENLADEIFDVDLLYHEATFIEEDADKALPTMHSTAKQAASIAQKANAGKLLLGHFSARYKELDQILNEAQSIFKNVELALEGSTFDIKED